MIGLLMLGILTLELLTLDLFSMVPDHKSFTSDFKKAICEKDADLSFRKIISIIF